MVHDAFIIIHIVIIIFIKIYIASELDQARIPFSVTSTSSTFSTYIYR